MAFTKGLSGNPSGRPKGSRNRATSNLRTLVGNFLQDNWIDFQKAYRKLSSKDKVSMFERMLKYNLPTLQSVSIGEEFENQLKALPDEQIEELMNRILDHYNSKKHETGKKGYAN